jgi:opacity protein-like surface antigen
MCIFRRSKFAAALIALGAACGSAPWNAQASDRVSAPEFFFKVSGHHQSMSDVTLHDRLPISVFGAWFIPAIGPPSREASVSDELGGALGFGARVAPWLRLELSLERTAESEMRWAYGGAFAHSTLSTRQLMANAYLDLAPIFGWRTLGPLSPYITAGIGLSWNKNGDYRCDPTLTCLGPDPYPNARTEKSLAWQVGAGFQWELAPRILLDASWRYMDLGETRGSNFSHAIGPSGGLEGDLDAHRLSLGLVFILGDF